MTVPQFMSPVVSVLIVSYNTKELTLDCLRSVVRETQRLSYEVIVVDNASSDGSADAIAAEFPGVALIRSEQNLGFAAANNKAAQVARGAFLLLLNPDTVALDRAIERLVLFARCTPQARIWGGRTLYGDGTLNPSSCWQRMSPWNLLCRATGLTGLFRQSEVFNAEAYGGWRRDTVRHVDIVSGCFLLIERRFWNDLGGFDAAFFMYGEEADLCLRAIKLGAEPLMTPEATIIHHGGASERVRADKMVRLLAAKSLLIDRHFPAGQVGLGQGLLAAWPLTRTLALTVAAALTGSRKMSESASIWQSVWLRRAEWLGSDPSAQRRSGTPGAAPKTGSTPHGA
ncbi:MAG: glycosyltransferase family 2 protein [Hyphomicrobiaceae bacterium]